MRKCGRMPRILFGTSTAQTWAPGMGGGVPRSPVAFIYGEDQMEYMMQGDAAWQAIGMQPMPLGSGAVVVGGYAGVEVTTEANRES